MAARRGADIHSLSEELSRRGATQMLQSDGIKYLLGSRLEAVLKGNEAGSGAFVLMPLEMLVGDDGIVAALRKRGDTVSAVA
jgi:hypothetical protein